MNGTEQSTIEMKYKGIILFLVGILIGWMTCPSLNAGEDEKFHGYKKEIIMMISLMKQIEDTSRLTEENTKEIADNTKAIKNYFGAN